MNRCIALACALGLWAGPVAAQELHLAPPTLSAQSDRCGTTERALCPTLQERGIESSLQCDACQKRPMPPELVAPPPSAPVSVPAGKRTTSPDCLPGASRPAPSSCVETPRLD
ncbi:MAG TPA: hypothetical protein VF997_08865, partial [Polyangia bacterium]